MTTSTRSSTFSWPRRLAILACLVTGCVFTLRALTPIVSATPSVSSQTAFRQQAQPENSSASSQTRLVTRNIEDIRLGQRVVGRNPLREQTQPASNIDPQTWRAVRLNMIQGGVEYDLAFLRPVSWLDATGAKVGGSIHMELHEMGLDGLAKVVGIDACPQIEADDGTGRNVVTGTMAHAGANILYLDITGLDEPLGVTDTHPIWSETRQDFVVAGQLEVGEQFRTLTGESATLTKIHPHRGPPQLVFNLEVDAEHVYAVAGSGLLVHNDCPFAMGIDQHLDSFASSHGASTWKQFDDVDTWKGQVLGKLNDADTPVLFNLDGIDVWPGVSRAGGGRGGATDWELLQIYKNPDFPNLHFFKDGVPTANPFR